MAKAAKPGSFLHCVLQKLMSTEDEEVAKLLPNRSLGLRRENHKRDQHLCSGWAEQIF
jgi:hypothetical protein